MDYIVGQYQQKNEDIYVFTSSSKWVERSSQQEIVVAFEELQSKAFKEIG